MIDVWRIREIPTIGVCPARGNHRLYWKSACTMKYITYTIIVSKPICILTCLCTSIVFGKRLLARSSNRSPKPLVHALLIPLTSVSPSALTASASSATPLPYRFPTQHSVQSPCPHWSAANWWAAGRCRPAGAEAPPPAPSWWPPPRHAPPRGPPSAAGLAWGTAAGGTGVGEGAARGGSPSRCSFQKPPWCPSAGTWTMDR